MFETLAERTLALAQLARRRDPSAGYEPLLDRIVSPILAECLAHGIRIVSNFGAANPPAAAKRPLVTTNLVVAETHRLLVHRAGLQPGRLFLERLDASPVLRVCFCTRAHHDAARDWLDRLDSPPLAYTDAASFAVMAAEGIRQVVGFDPAFDWAGFTRVQA